MSVTLKEIIIKKYVEFVIAVKDIVDSSLFPNIDDVDVVDILALIEIFFPENVETIKSLETVIALKELSISEDQLSKLVVVLDTFLAVIKKIKQL